MSRRIRRGVSQSESGGQGQDGDLPPGRVQERDGQHDAREPDELSASLHAQRLDARAVVADDGAGGSRAYCTESQTK